MSASASQENQMEESSSASAAASAAEQPEELVKNKSTTAIASPAPPTPSTPAPSSLVEDPHTLINPHFVATPTEISASTGLPPLPLPLPPPPPTPSSAGIVACPLCMNCFANLPDMKNHLELEHHKYQCDICRKLMSHKRNVDRHRKSVHENRRGFGCPMCNYKSAHKQVVQRHLATKHQIKREESPPIPYRPTTVSESMLDIKPYLSHPYYTNPPWLTQHDYHHSNYYQTNPSVLQAQYENYIMEAQHAMENRASVLNNHSMNLNNVLNNHGNNANNRPEMMMDTATSGSSANNENNGQMVNALQDPITVPTEGTDENGNNLNKNEAEKKPPLTAQVSFEDNHVRIVFQRAMNIHVVEVPFPEI